VKRLALALGLAVSLMAAPLTAHAHDAYDDSESHPLRLAAYAIHPVGFLFEWVFTRPLHFMVSAPHLERVFGHVPHENAFGGYQAYEPDYQ